MKSRPVIPFVLLLLAAPAAAGREARSEGAARVYFRVSIPLGDLDLGTPNGRAELDARIERLARITCGSGVNSSAYDQSNVAECRSNFEASARNALRSRERGGR
jgi:UrcA family protein